jgi:hypothetical protein
MAMPKRSWTVRDWLIFVGAVAAFTFLLQPWMVGWPPGAGNLELFLFVVIGVFVANALSRLVRRMPSLLPADYPRDEDHPRTSHRSLVIVVGALLVALAFIGSVLAWAMLRD